MCSAANVIIDVDGGEALARITGPAFADDAECGPVYKKLTSHKT
jgi:hypothetical protein